MLQENHAPSVSWQPERAGTYTTVRAFVWTSIDTPAPLSFAGQESTIDINNCSGSALCFTGIVTRVTDGDTLRVDDIVIRLSLVNTPERGDAGYSEATAFTAAKCPVGSAALVDEDDGQTSGSYGRIVAKLYRGDKVLNEELLRAGHAEVYTQHCDDSKFAREDWVAKYC
jgi:endonuclease YncB( thermonuclease family)